MTLARYSAAKHGATELVLNELVLNT